jgi:hypothetical protein
MSTQLDLRKLSALTLQSMSDGDSPDADDIAATEAWAAESSAAEPLSKAESFLYKPADKHVLEMLATTPLPFLEPEGPKPYRSEIADRLVPPGGFVSDFLNLGRGNRSAHVVPRLGCILDPIYGTRSNCMAQVVPKTPLAQSVRHVRGPPRIVQKVHSD